MDLSIYFDPIQIEDFKFIKRSSRKTFGDMIVKNREGSYFPHLDDIQLALIGVGEERAQVDNQGCGEGINAIRDYFYDLFPGNYQPNIADLGNLRLGHTI